MSGDNDPDDTDQSGQGGQPPEGGQGGQPPQGGQGGQGGQPPQGGQGGQPGQPAQGGQPGQPAQGGQPGQPAQGGQPGQPAQGGQPGQPAQGGQGYQQPVNQGPGLADKLQRPEVMHYLKTTIAVYAVVGVGLGLAAFLIGSVEEPLIGLDIDTSGLGQQQQQSQSVGSASLIILYGFPLVAAVLATAVGTRYSQNIAEDETTVAAAAAVATLAGTIVLWFLGGFISSLGLPDLYSLEFGGLLINSIIAGIGVGIIGGGVAYVERMWSA